MTDPNNVSVEDRFVNHLHDLIDRRDRAALAELRQGLGKRPAAASGSHRHVLPYLPRDMPLWREDAFYLVASLFALHPTTRWAGIRQAGSPATNLGASFGRLAYVVDSEGPERRFTALLNASLEEVPNHLRHAVQLFREHDIPVDWAELLRDLRWWSQDTRTVQRRWARAFWRGPVEHEEVDRAPGRS